MDYSTNQSRPLVPFDSPASPLSTSPLFLLTFLALRPRRELRFRNRIPLYCQLLLFQKLVVLSATLGVTENAVRICKAISLGFRRGVLYTGKGARKGRRGR